MALHMLPRIKMPGYETWDLKRAGSHGNLPEVIVALVEDRLTRFTIYGLICHALGNLYSTARRARYNLWNCEYPLRAVAACSLSEKGYGNCSPLSSAGRAYHRGMDRRNLSSWICHPVLERKCTVQCTSAPYAKDDRKDSSQQSMDYSCY